MKGLEPLTPSLPWKCSTSWATSARIAKKHGWCFRATLRFCAERETRLEPATFSLEGWCSTNWATPACLFFAWGFMQTCWQKWGEEDSNLRRHKSTDLQSAPFGRSGISPRKKRWNMLKNKSRWRDSNPRPTDYKSVALANWATSAIHQMLQNRFVLLHLKNFRRANIHYGMKIKNWISYRLE